MEAAVLLRRLGFSEYEGKAYIALLQRNPLTGYELAKQSGVPRADIYSVLQRLEDRGAVLRLENDSGTRFAPVAPGEVVGNLERSFQETADQARHSMEQVAPATDLDQAWNVRGRAALIEQARTLVENTTSHLLLALGPDESAELKSAIDRADRRGVGITILCHRSCPTPCPHCRGEVHRHRTVPEEIEEWLMVVRDGEEMVAGLLGPGGQAAGLRSRQPLLVGLASWHVRNGIALAALIDDLGPELAAQLRPETQQTLHRLGTVPGKGWLEQMVALAGQGSQARKES